MILTNLQKSLRLYVQYKQNKEICQENRNKIRMLNLFYLNAFFCQVITSFWTLSVKTTDYGNTI